MMFPFALFAFPKLFKFFVSLEFYPSILEPNLDLRFGQVQFFGDSLSFFSNDVVITYEAFL